MQKILYILSIFLLVSVHIQAQVNCCPHFEGRTDRYICDTCPGVIKSPINGEPRVESSVVACRNGVHEYFVVPGNLAGFTYQWHVLGGDIIDATGNVLANPLTNTTGDISVKWGTGNSGEIEVDIKNSDGSCKDTLRTNFAW